MLWNSFSMNRNCNVRGGCVTVKRQTAPIFRWSCFHIAEGYEETVTILILALGSLLINCF